MNSLSEHADVHSAIADEVFNFCEATQLTRPENLNFDLSARSFFNFFSKPLVPFGTRKGLRQRVCHLQ